VATGEEHGGLHRARSQWGREKDNSVGDLPRYLSHSGGHPGFISYFNVDRAKQNGIVIMINGNEDWKKKDAEYGVNALRFDVYEAFKRAYR
jgi:hypothetical protein